MVDLTHAAAEVPFPASFTTPSKFGVSFSGECFMHSTRNVKSSIERGMKVSFDGEDFDGLQ